MNSTCPRRSCRCRASIFPCRTPRISAFVCLGTETGARRISLYAYEDAGTRPRPSRVFRLKKAARVRPTMKEYQREALLERADRDSVSVGVRVPDKVELEDGELALNEYVFEARAGEIDNQDVKEKKKLLRRKRAALLDEIRESDLTYEEGERIVERVAGIDRALNILQGTGGDIEAEARAKEKADEKRWIDFLKKVTGSDGEDSRL